MKRVLIFLPFVAWASLLSDLKLKEIDLDKKEAYHSSKETEKSWINPLMLTYSYSKDNSLGDIKTTNTLFSISVNQPVFKSGAIYYSLKYAKHLKSYTVLNIEKKKRELIKTAYDLAIDYKITKLNEKIILLNIKNAKIDIKKKKEDFLNGVGDSTFLNNAVLNFNSLKLSLEDIKLNLVNLKYSFKNLSSLDIEKVELPKFRLVTKNEFVNKNIDYLIEKKNKKVKKDLYKMQVGNQLLSVNLNASLNWQEIDYSKNTPQLNDVKTDFYRVGVSVTLPLSANALNKIEKSKVEYLKTELNAEDVKNTLINKYYNLVSQIKTLDNKIKIYRENIKIYDDLINSTIESITAGNATEDDLRILKNSQKTMKYNIEITKLKKEKIMLSLYYNLQGL